MLPSEVENEGASTVETVETVETVATVALSEQPHIVSKSNNIWGGGVVMVTHYTGNPSPTTLSGQIRLTLY
jgi:hypothetical protein